MKKEKKGISRKRKQVLIQGGIMRRKWICALLCISFVIPFAACAAKENSSYGDGGLQKGSYKEFITVDVYDEFANYQGVQSGWFAKAVKDRFHMELNFIAPNVSGGGDTLYQTRAAAGSLGDLILINTSNGKFKELVESGLVMDCTEFIKEKEIMKHYGDAVRKTNELTQSDGIYGFPNSISSQPATVSSESLDPVFGPYIRWDYYKKAGCPEMKNLADFLDVLEQMQRLAREEEGDDDIYAVSLFRSWDYSMMNNAKQIACMYGYDEQGFILARADGQDYQNIADKDSLYIKALRFLNEANARGLVNPESVSQDYDNWLSGYDSGKVLYSPWPWAGQSTYNTASNKAAGRGFMMAAVKDMRILSYGCWPQGDSARVIAIGKGTKDPQRLADFIDWLYSPEGIEMSGQANGAAGPKGLTWDIGEDEKPVLTAFGKQALPNNPARVPEDYGGGRWDAGVSALNFRTVNLAETDPVTGYPYDYLCWESVREDTRSALDADWSSTMGADTAMEYLEQHDMLLTASGANYSTPAEDANITTVRDQCKKTVIDYSWRMIFAPMDEFDALLTEMQHTLKGLGYDAVCSVDLKNAKDQAAAREEVAERTAEKKNP